MLIAVLVVAVVALLGWAFTISQLKEAQSEGKSLKDLVEYQRGELHKPAPLPIPIKKYKATFCGRDQHSAKVSANYFDFNGSPHAVKFIRDNSVVAYFTGVESVVVEEDF